MRHLQDITDGLVLGLDASRCVLRRREPRGGAAILAQSTQHEAPQLASDAPGETSPLMEATADGALTLELYDLRGPRTWSDADRAALRRARDDLAARMRDVPAVRASDLARAAAQAILDRLRAGIDAQRCTYRQPVYEFYAFPVTVESRAEGVNPLLGDFTVVQVGQPVIAKLLGERAQVVQPDCRSASAEPHFQWMLGHYGGLAAQVVTPVFAGEAMTGVLSVHELRAPRRWTESETTACRDAARLLGAVFAAAAA